MTSLSFFPDINGFEIGSKKLNYLLYADDLLLLCKCRSDLQLRLSRLHKYTIKWGLKINIKKSKLIVFSKYRRRNHKLYINGEQLEQVDEYTYLGILFYRTGCLRQASLSLRKKASKASMSLLQALCKKNISINILLNVFDNTVGPILTCGSEVWGSFSLQSKTMYDNGNLTPEQYFMKTDTELACMKFCRRILMTNRCTSSLAAVGELSRCPEHISIISKIIKFWHCMANLDESCFLKQAYNVKLSYLHRNSDQWLKFVYDIMKLCDMEDYFLDPSKSSASLIANKITKILEDRFIKFWRSTVWSGIRNTNTRSDGDKLRLHRHVKNRSNSRAI